MSGWQYHGRAKQRPPELSENDPVLVKSKYTIEVATAGSVNWSRVDAWQFEDDDCVVPKRDMDDLRRQRDMLAGSLLRLRERLTVVARDARIPIGVRNWLLALRHGHPRKDIELGEDTEAMSDEWASPIVCCTTCGAPAVFIDGLCGACYQAGHTDDQLRVDRNRLAESLCALRHRIAAVIRDPSTPDPERRRLVSLLSGVEFERAIEEGFQRRDHREEHQDAEGRGEADCTGGGNRPQAGGEGCTEEVTQA